jgi:hypothetical protein
VREIGSERVPEEMTIQGKGLVRETEGSRDRFAFNEKGNKKGEK